MQFNHVEEIYDLWQDYTASTPLEALMVRLENEIHSWDLSLIENEYSYSFQYNGCEYLIRYITQKVGERNCIYPFLNFDNYLNRLSLYFETEPPFFLISSKNGVSGESNYQGLMTILSTLVNFKCPVFIQLSNQDINSEEILFTGRYVINSPRNGGVVDTFFSSNVFNFDEFQNKKYEFDNPKQILNFVRNGFFAKDSKVTYFLRKIYRIENDSLLSPIIIVVEWPNITDTSMKFDFMKAPRHMISVGSKEISKMKKVYQFQYAYSIVESHNEINFNQVPQQKLKEMQKTEDFKSFVSSDLQEMEINVDYIPSGSILSIIAKCLNGEYDYNQRRNDFDLVWHDFLKYLRECVKKEEFIKAVDCTKVNLKCCILYQKLQLINICIAKNKMKRKDHIETSNYVITSDLLASIMKIIKYDKDSTANVDYFLNSILEYRSSNKNATLEDYISSWKLPSSKQKKSNANQKKKTATIIWNAIPAAYFDFDQQIELAVDYFEGLSPIEAFPSLLIIIICERLNCICKLKVYKNALKHSISQIEESIILLKNKANDVKSSEEVEECKKNEIPAFDISNFIEDCKTIEESIEDLEERIKIDEFCKINGFEASRNLTNTICEKGYAITENQYEAEMIWKYFQRVKKNGMNNISQCEHHILNGNIGKIRTKINQRIFLYKNNRSTTVATRTTEEIY